MRDYLQLVQILPNNDIIPLTTSAQGEVDAANTMDSYPGAGYHFLYAKLELKELTPAQEYDVFTPGTEIKEFW